MPVKKKVNKEEIKDDPLQALATKSIVKEQLEVILEDLQWKHNRLQSRFNDINFFVVANLLVAIGILVFLITTRP